jgi:O-antigen ligase
LALVRGGVSVDSLALAGACLLVFMAASVAARQVRGSQLVPAVALAWLLAAAVSTVIALVQYFGAADHLTPWISGSASGEAFANLRQRNQFASLTVIGMAALFWLFRDQLRRWPALILMALLAVGDAATTSRTGLAQMLLLGLLACLWPGPRRKRAALWLVGLIAYLFAALVLPSLLEFTTGVEGHRLWDRVAAVGSCSSRIALWSNVLHLIAQKPWLGWGWGELDYAHFVTLYQGPRFCDILDNAHSLPLHLAVELGIPAALLLCGGLLWATFIAKPWREEAPTRQMAWAVLAVIGVHSLLEYPLWYGPFQMALGLSLGLLWPADRPGPAGPARPEALGGRPATGLLAVLVSAACVYAAWDYRRVSQIYLPPEERASAYREEIVEKLRGSWLFRNQSQFAELTITPLSRENAQWTFDMANAMLHYSPEPRVIRKVIESAIVLGRDAEAAAHLARYRAAFAEDYAIWAQANLSTPPHPAKQ